MRRCGTIPRPGEDFVLTTTENVSHSNNRTAGPIAVSLAVLYAAFLIASLVVVPVLAPSARIPNPFGPDDASRSFLLNNTRAIQISDFLQLVSAICFAGLAAALAALQRIAKAPIVASALTQSGGIGGAVMLATTALCSWAIASPGATDPGPAFHTFQFLPFLFGGPGWAGFFAVFMASVAMGGKGILPRWVTVSGYFLAAVSALATMVLVTIYAAPCLPIARFLGFLWLILVAVLFARTRRIN
jgi:hypothetical protein